ncbi:MAG: ornithine carbamoyltransferase [Candidatus Omnitrophota bacterium]|nr:MAG: ornithine carbamoyltransferase [Candidatus Omnitrophota bacterium]
MKHLLSIKDLSLEEIEKIFSLAEDVRDNPERFRSSLKQKVFALIFHKPSLRTRISFEVGIFQMGGKALYLEKEIGFPEREAIKDIARVLSVYLHGVIIRTFSHQLLLEFAAYSQIPVINALSDLLHPCQVLSDLFTIKQKKGDLKKVKLAYIGDGNNVCHSLIYGCAKTNTSLSIATPARYLPSSKIVEEAGGKVEIGNNPQEAVKGADVVYTDVWTSMGKEKEREERKKEFSGFQVNEDLLKKAKPDCLLMHCLPAHRGEEVTDQVIEGKQSIVFDQAENRLYVQKAILLLIN